MVGDVASGRLLRAEAEGHSDQAETLGRQVAEALFAQGAAAFLGGH